MQEFYNLLERPMRQTMEVAGMAANETNATSLKDASRISEGDSIMLGGGDL